MKIISQFKDTGEGLDEYVYRHTHCGDVVLDGCLIFIRIDGGFVTEYGTYHPYIDGGHTFKRPVLFKRGLGDLLYLVMEEAERRCSL